MLIVLLLIVPLAGAVASCLAAKRGEDMRDRIYLAELALVFALALAGFVSCASGNVSAIWVPGICGIGLNFRMDGFRALYALVASFMWLMTGLMSKEYFAKYRNRTRYYLFNQITLLATLGVFLSDDFYTCFVFFEIMSLSSYPWVAHDENPGAMKAAATYLAIAVFGGMVTLMGLFMLYSRFGPRTFDGLALVPGRKDMILPAALILVGFGAKAGLFPLYVWLPKAHPVAPAPASALLSGVLTKTGVFGVLVVCLRLMLGCAPFGNVMLALGLITMLLGAGLALFSTNLKRILACSSMSQIGYITVGVAMAMLLGEEGHVPVSGAVMHMVNHSILKLTLFMAAGVVYMNLHRLELDDIRGFGRGKPALHAAFLLGALGLSGVPLFNGYLGKTLIHEGILEFAREQGGFGIYNICEWIFLFAAGITLAYMLKIYIALFWQRHPERQADFDRRSGSYMNCRTAFALCASMALIPILGMFPAILEAASRMSAGFTGIEGVSGVHYFSFENLRGGGISLLIGVLVYLFVVRRYLYRNGKYIAVGREWNLQKSAPARLGLRAVDGVCEVMDHALENPLFMEGVPTAATAVARAVSEAVDGAAHLLRRTALRATHAHDFRKHWLYYGFAYLAGHILDAFAVLLNLTVLRGNPIQVDFTYVLAARVYDRDPELGRATRTVSFGLLLFAAGLLLMLVYLVIL